MYFQSFAAVRAAVGAALFVLAGAVLAAAAPSEPWGGAEHPTAGAATATPAAGVDREPAAGAPFRGYRRLDTEHFRIIYEPRDRDSAVEIAGYADEVFDELARYLENRPQRRIHVWINGRTDAANGYFMPLPPNHIAVHVAAPTTPWVGARTDNWLYLVFVHELIHHLHLMYEQGALHLLSRVFGEPVLAFPGLFMPGWAIEGVAVEGETRFSRGGRGRSPYFEHYYAAPMIEDQMFDYARAGFDSYRPPRGRFYVAGYLLIDYLTAEYGADVVARIQQEYLRFPIYSWERAIERVTGVSAEHNFLFMTRRLEQRFGWRRSLPTGKAVSPAIVGDYHLPRITERGLYTFRTRPDRPAAIVRFPFKPGVAEQEVIRTGALVDGASFDVSPDGRLILFSAYRTTMRHRGPQRQSAELYLWRKETGVQRIPDASGLHHPTFVNERYAVGVQRAGSDRRLVWVDLRSGAVAPLYEPADGRALYWPQVSPDGTRLLFTENDRGVQTVRELYLPQPGALAEGEPNTIPSPPDSPAYRARYAGDDRILLSLESGGMLVLHAWQRGSDTPRALLADSVGVISAEEHAGSLYYATYRSDGYALRRIALADLPAGVDLAREHLSRDYRLKPKPDGPLETPHLPPGHAPEGGSERESQNAPRGELRGEPRGERRFVDAPRIGLWLPVPSLVEGADGVLYWGGGIFALGGTFTDPASTHVVATYHPQVEQPYLNAATQFRYGRLGLGLTARHRYRRRELENSLLGAEGPSEYVEQRSELELRPSILLYGAHERGVLRRLSLYGLAQYTRLVAAQEDFALSWDAPAGGDSRETIELGAGLQAQRSGPRAERDLYSPRLATGRVQLSRDLPEYGTPRTGVRTRADSEFAIPLAAAGRSLSLTSSMEHTTGRPRRLSPFPPPGFAEPASEHGMPGWLRARLAYRWTLALTDIPLPLGFNIGGFAAALFAERQAGFDPEHTEAQLQEAVYLGVELLTLLGYNIGRFPVRTGISVKLSPDETPEARFYLGL